MVLTRADALAAQTTLPVLLTASAAAAGDVGDTALQAALTKVATDVGAVSTPVVLEDLLRLGHRQDTPARRRGYRGPACPPRRSPP